MSKDDFADVSKIVGIGTSTPMPVRLRSAALPRASARPVFRGGAAVEAIQRMRWRVLITVCRFHWWELYIRLMGDENASKS
jgi:hypothetical protein